MNLIAKIAGIKRVARQMASTQFTGGESARKHFLKTVMGGRSATKATKSIRELSKRLKVPLISKQQLRKLRK